VTVARSWLLLSIWGGAACAPPAESEPAPSPFQGGTLARGYGVTLKKVAYVPNDRRQSFGLVETCEALDGSRCAPRAWAPAELDSVAQATALLERGSGFQTRVEAKDPEVRIHARSETLPGAGCADGSVTCWFGSTDCSEGAGVLLDASGAPVLDSYAASTWSFTACSRWAVEVSVLNIYTWADFLGLEREHVLGSVILHEMGHTLGLEHTRLGIMRPHLPVCYFIDPGDARDVFDPTSTEDSFQRYDCLEGVKEPAFSPGQRAKLDAFRGGAPGWSMVTPGASG
jgi:hypothetical protein